jgi:hypothetical protein
MMITCRELVDLLIDFVSGSLPSEHHERVQHHLKKCPPCEVYLQTYQLTIQLTRKLPCQPLPPALEERLRAALEELCQERSKSAGSPRAEGNEGGI